MIGGNVEQHRHTGVKLLGRCDLIARKLRHKPLVMRTAVDLVHRSSPMLPTATLASPAALSR